LKNVLTATRILNHTCQFLKNSTRSFVEIVIMVPVRAGRIGSLPSVLTAKFRLSFSPAGTGLLPPARIDVFVIALSLATASYLSLNEK
jgi:hypothetical protein